MAQQLNEALRDEYASLFARMSIRPERRSQINAICSRIAEPRLHERYDEVEQDTGVPWFVVALIHNLEASQRLSGHLHNGDPLTGRTFHVPANRPREGGPPFTWRASAADALRMKRLDRWTDWSVPGIAFVLERFNGFGYRNNHPHVKSPYLWSFSNVYTSGKYISDGVFSNAAVSQQCGGMVLLRALMDVDASIRPRIGAVEEPETEEDDQTRPFPHDEGPDEGERPPPETGPRTPAPPYPGRYLQFGIEDDPEVLRVQQRLRELAADPGSLDGDFGEVTELAVKLFQARSSNLAGEPLEIDGVVGPETWAALFGPESIEGDGIQAGEEPPPPPGSLAAAVIDVAGREVGVRESPLGSNRGPRVDQYIRAAGLDPTRDSFPWCMCFVFFCFQQAAQRLGVPNRVPRNASVHLAWQATKTLGAPVRFIEAAAARRDPSLVKPGMAFFIDTGGGKGHTGLIAVNLNGSLETIEGNTTSVTGSREGIGVFRRTRRRVVDPSIMGFASYG
jgi:lysozyme family protein